MTEPNHSTLPPGRRLREMMLTTPAERAGVKPSEAFPRVYALLMDWPLSNVIATVFASSTGAASLYTTSTLGIIGGEAHETVRTAATRFVSESDRFYEASMRTNSFPYPARERVRFYLLTFAGVRCIDTGLPAIQTGRSDYSTLFGLGQVVLTELRLVTEKER